MDLDREVDRIYLQHYVPAGVVVNEELEVLQFRGQTGLFLEHRPGHATLNLLQMVKPHLVHELKNAILTVRNTGLPFGKAGLQTQLKGVTIPFSLDVFPLLTSDGRNFLVVFKDSELSPGAAPETVTLANEAPKDEIASPAPVSVSDEQLRREKWLQAFSEALPTMMCYTRADNTTLFFNSAWLSYTGRPEASEANGGWMMGIHPVDQPDFLHLYNRRSEKGETFETTLRLLRFDGEYCPVSLAVMPVVNAGDSFEGYMISCWEVAEKNVLPLETDRNKPPQDPVLSELTNQEKTEAPETVVKTDLNLVVKKVVKEFEWLIKEKNANIQFDQLPIMHAMPQQMEQLFYHLIGNALQFTHRKRTPEIWISAKKLSGEKWKRYQQTTPLLLYYEIIIQDNGIGMPAKQAFAGTGTGLARCRKIVENHKGDIYAEAKENEGTRVHVILPARQQM